MGFGGERVLGALLEGAKGLPQTLASLSEGGGTAKP